MIECRSFKPSMAWLYRCFKPSMARLYHCLKPTWLGSTVA